jgi:exosome complex component RRP42
VEGLRRRFKEVSMDIQRDYILRLASEGKRIDKRGFEDFRKIEIEKNPIEKPEGSARVKMGETEVIVGVKLGVGEPFPDKPDEGVLIVSAELSPISFPEFETGPPREEAIELARVVDRGIREAQAIDTKKLCISPGEKVWTVFIDVQIINHDGNLIDAYSLASLAALLNARMPEYDGEKINYEKTAGPLPLKAKPVAVTVFRMPGGKLFADANLEEERVSEARLTVTTKEDGNVTALQKGGSPMTLEEIESAIKLSVKKGKELRKLL